MTRDIRLLLTSYILLLTFSSGCLYYGHHGPRPSLSLPSVPGDSSYFDYAREPITAQVLSASKRNSYTVQKLLFPTYTAFLYIPDGITPAPAVVVLPITSGNYHAKQMAHYLAANGFVCLRFLGRVETLLAIRNSEDPIKGFELFLKGFVLDVLQGIDWLTAHPSVDRERIGVVGISLGGIIAVIATGVDPRLKAGVFLLSGGDLAGILFSSKEPLLEGFRNRMEDQEDLTPEELRQSVGARLLNLDPLTYAGRVDPSRILMINAYFDQVIKRRYTMALWKALGKPPMIQLPAGHYSSALFFGYAERKTLAHLKKALGP